MKGIRWVCKEEWVDYRVKPIGDECKVVLMKGIRWVGEEGWADYRVKPIGDECKVVL